ncbi:predicted protein [Histoplasma mississippiense (nom. inval.)]|uniref:predicted protein n=1 Tax=Ajellomyces capsulatus (strain NAm1 / WU24) TaxID=2059318 RepID=UPI000157B9B5|nr:predicted protein [Histoplasma mississippiense (nom. inval.)]EDN03368.1 predicted protein [Histoplasma mississippiense (nom. inval.)]
MYDFIDGKFAELGRYIDRFDDKGGGRKFCFRKLYIRHNTPSASFECSLLLYPSVAHLWCSSYEEFDSHDSSHTFIKI